MTERKPTIGFWAAMAAVAAFAYLLSFGPAVWLMDRLDDPRIPAEER
jgi:hypothetical protein